MNCECHGVPTCPALLRAQETHDVGQDAAARKYAARWTHAYLGSKPCGCAVAFVADDPDDARETAKAVAEFIRDGLTISRVTIDESRIRICRCTHVTRSMGGSSMALALTLESKTEAQS